MPFLLEEDSVLLNDTLNLGDFATSKASRPRQCNRLQPEICVSLNLFDVNMGRLFALPAEKEKSISLVSQEGGTQ
jgi:hypothetical protein